MQTSTRKKWHLSIAIVFALGYIAMLVLNIFWPHLFLLVWKQVLLFISFYAVVATHLAGASAETPT